MDGATLDFFAASFGELRWSILCEQCRVGHAGAASGGG